MVFIQGMGQLHGAAILIMVFIMVSKGKHPS